MLRRIEKALRRRGWRHETDLAQVRVQIAAGIAGDPLMDIDLSSLYYLVKWGGGYVENLTNVRVSFVFEKRDDARG